MDLNFRNLSATQVEVIALLGAYYAEQLDEAEVEQTGKALAAFFELNFNYLDEMARTLALSPNEAEKRTGKALQVYLDCR